MLTRRQTMMLGALSPLWVASRSLGQETLAALATRLATADAICAVAVSTIRNGVPDQSIQVSGCAPPAPAGSVFQAASLSKPVVAHIAMKIVARKQLDLDTPVSKYLPHGYTHRQNLFALNAAPRTDVVPVEILQAVTPRHLLTHTAGFPNWANSGPLSLEFSPGSRWQYSGEGYVLLQTVLETITGKPLEQLAEDTVFGPLRMVNSSFKLNGRIDARLVSGSPRQLRFPSEIASSSLYTTAADYALFLAAVLNDQSLLASTLDRPVELPRSWRSLIQSTQLFWGLGWGLEVRDRPVSIWHWGSNPGFRALVLADLASRNGVVVLTASQTGMSAAKAIVGATIPGSHPALDLDAVQ